MTPYQALQNAIKVSLQQIEAFHGNSTFTWNGEDYACSPSGVGEGGEVVEGGILADADLVLVVRKEVFPNGIYPTEGLITYQGTNFRVDSVRTDSTGTFVRLVCNAPNEDI